MDVDFGDINNGDAVVVLLKMDKRDFDRSLMFGVILDVTGGVSPNNCCKWNDWLRLSFSKGFVVFFSRPSSIGSVRCFDYMEYKTV